MLDHIRGVGRVEVSELSVRFGVSAETVRRDLTALEDHGLVSRTHGAVFPSDGARFETSLSVRAAYRVPEKRRIAAVAAGEVGGARTLFVDEGYTHQLIAEELRALRRPLTVVTASLEVARVLAPAEWMSVIQLGGRVRDRTMGTVDHWALDMLSDLVIDLAILGSNGISLDRGLTTPDPAVQALKTRVVKVSQRRVFAGVSTKFGVKSFCRFADVADFQTLITDTGLSAYDADRYGDLGPAVIRVRTPRSGGGPPGASGSASPHGRRVADYRTAAEEARTRLGVASQQATGCARAGATRPQTGD